jgi:ubiquinol-cytochrome c reductase cytochrome c subunit
VTAARAARRHRVSAYLVVFVALAIIGAAYAALAPSGRADTKTPNADLIATGNRLFLQGCSSCHGLSGQGSSLAPSLVGVGGAAVDFQVGTGRMPLALRGPEANTKPVRYTQSQIDALAAYVESLGGGPNIPQPSDYDTTNTDLTQGGELFRTNCASCHNFVGKGGALAHGLYAPDLTNTTPKHIYEAMTTGPANMPLFGDKTLTPDQKRDIIKYITTLRTQADPGGAALGRLGPVPEGLVGWLVGIGVCVIAAVWIGARAR